MTENSQHELTPFEKEHALLIENIWLRYLVMAFGFLFMLLGIMGILLPIMPGTIFLILATACFVRSSPRFENWIMHNRYVGPAIADYRSTGVIDRNTKIIITVTMCFSFVGLELVDAPLWVWLVVGGIIGAVLIFVWRHPDEVRG